MHFKKYILLYTLIPLLIITVAASYYRFIVLHDYVVAYEIECDPVLQSCFVGCEDDECSAKYHYAIMQRHASDLIELCGVNIVGCDEASICQAGESECAILFCDDQTLGHGCDDVGDEEVRESIL